MINSFDVEKMFGKAYKDFLQAVSDYNMLEKFSRGVVVALSGGADSVFLLLCMHALSKKEEFPICAMHVNHNIRGEEADRDERFCESICRKISVEFHARRADVPAIAKENNTGIELTARNVRYDFLQSFVEKSDKFSYIVTAHNATDNTETVIFNILRGGGTQAVCGIPVVRDNILRPIIYIPKKDIVSSLEQNCIEYVVDSTNTDINYSRNYIRHEILPHMEHLNPSFEGSVRRLNNNASADIAFIEKQVDAFCEKHCVTSTIERRAVTDLDYAILSRVVVRMYDFACEGISKQDLEYNHIRKICALIGEGKSFFYDIPSGMTFCADRKTLSVFKKDASPEKIEFSVGLRMGENKIPFSDGIIYLTEDKNDSHISKLKNVYNFSIQATLVFDKICGELYMRNRQDGDKYRYGGMTHKLKKLYIDAKMSADEKATLPIICDDEGILWVPRFGVRDAFDSSKNSDKKIYALYCCNGGKNA